MELWIDFVNLLRNQAGLCPLIRLDNSIVVRPM